MRFVAGHRAIRDHVKNGKQLLLFKQVRKAYVEFRYKRKRTIIADRPLSRYRFSLQTLLSQLNIDRQACPGELRSGSDRLCRTMEILHPRQDPVVAYL